MPPTSQQSWPKALFDYRDPKTDQQTRTLLLSATPYRMYTMADDTDSDHYRRLSGHLPSSYTRDAARIKELERRFAVLREGIHIASAVLDDAEASLSRTPRGSVTRSDRICAR